MDFTQFFASMSLSKSDASPKDSLSRACPAACGALITAKDPHPFCEVCLGLKHAEEALENPDNCSHCFMLPNKLQRCHLKVAVTHCIDLSLSESDGERVTTHYWGPPGAQRLDWADQPNPAFPKEDIFADNLSFTDKPGDLAFWRSPGSTLSGWLHRVEKLVLPNKMDRFSASVHQAAYKSSALAVRALNVSSLLSTYQVEILEKGSPSPTLRKEILTVNDLVLCNARQAV